MKTDGIILDVDGTLWNSTPIVARAWTKAVQEGGCKDLVVTAQMLQNLFGRTMKLIADLLLPELEPERRYEIMDVCCEYEHRALEEDECRICYPGVIETIKELSEKIPMCIVSNCQSGYIELFLEKTGLGPYVKDIECYGNTRRSKAENIQLVIERNGFKNAVYVGDTQGDLDSSREAGIPFIFASYGFGDPQGPDAVLGSFAELKELVEPA